MGTTAQQALPQLTITKGKKVDPPRIFLYAPPGFGKSTFASESPDPIFLDVERGSASLDVFRLCDDVQWTWPTLLSIVRALEKHPVLQDRKTIVIDTVDAVERLIFDYLVEKFKPRDKSGLAASIEAFGYGKGYKIALDEWKLFLSAIDRVRLIRRVAILFLGHCQVKAFKNPEGEDYDRYLPRINVEAGGMIAGQCDCVLFGSYETTEDATTKKVIGTGARILRTSWAPAYEAKTRFAIGDSLPLNAGKFWRALAEGRKIDSKTLLAQIATITSTLSDEHKRSVEESLSSAGQDATALQRVLEQAQALARPEGDKE